VHNTNDIGLLFGIGEDGGLTMENGKWKMENGEWRMENGEWRMTNAYKLISNF